MNNTNSKREGTQSLSRRPVRCAIYTRVSTDDQAKGEYSSLRAQKDICEHYISIHREDGWVSAVHFEDPGFTGSDMDRPGIKALLSEVRAGNVDMLVVYKLDRISRSLRQFYDFWETLQHHNVHFASATQQIDTATPHGMLFLNMLLSFGEFEREQTRERTVSKLSERAKHGKWNGGWTPLGYVYDKTTQKLAPNPDEKKLIEDVFNQAIRLKNPTAVAKHLNDLGCRTRERTLVRKDGTTRTVGEKRFIGYRVRATISNPLYKGMIEHDGVEYPAEHPGIVSKEVWQAANDALSRKAGVRRTYRRDKHVHLLKGLLKCGHCGLSLTPKPAGKRDQQGIPYLYYTCNNVSKDGGAATCKVRNIPVRAFEDLIIRYIGQIGEHPDLIEQTVRAANDTKNKAIRPLKAKLDQLDKHHAELAEAVQRCFETAKKKGAKNLSEAFIQEGERSATELRQVELEREKLKIDIRYKEKVVTDARIIADTLKQFDQVIQKLPDEEQKELIRLLVKEITVNHFDPEKDKDPSGAGVFKAKLRTRWYAVDIALYANDLFAKACEEGVNSSYSDLNGSGDRARTCNILVNSQALYH
jgi:site-specific DNA recombinase